MPDYDVGYRKPPKQSRFKQGQSGNPRGRPRGTRNFKTEFLEALNTLMRVTKDGVPKKVSTRRALVLRLIDMALKGTSWAMERVIALAQTYNVDGADDQPLVPDLSRLTDEQLEILSEATRILDSLAPAGAGGGGDLTPG